jgi:hypothetical protein
MEIFGLAARSPERWAAPPAHSWFFLIVEPALSLPIIIALREMLMAVRCPGNAYGCPVPAGCG